MSPYTYSTWFFFEEWIRIKAQDQLSLDRIESLDANQVSFLKSVEFRGQHQNRIREFG